MRGRCWPRLILAGWITGLGCGCLGSHQAFAAQGAANATRQILGAVKNIRGATITVAPDNGAEVNIEVRANARVLRIAPGETNLANAATIQLSEIQPGDRVLVTAGPGADTQTMAGIRVIVMKKSDVDAKQQADQLDWQRRGIAGLVRAVDAAGGVVTVAASGPAGTRTIMVHASSATKVRRYAPDSVRFDDAIASTLTQIKPGDQLRARGTRSADGGELNAEEIVAGTFRNISGKISSIDLAAGTVTVDDLATKKPVVVKVSSQSHVTKLTPEAAQAFAMRFRAAQAGRGAGQGEEGAQAGSAGNRGAQGRGVGAAGGRGFGGADAREAGGGRGGAGGGGQADLQQVISRMPPAPLESFNKGDAVMVVSTEGTAAGATAITMVGGVEPILTAPNGQQQTLAPWDLGGGGGGEGGAQ